MRPILLILSLAGIASLGSAATLRVPQDYDRIQRAIFAAEPGDTIAVAAGTYQENLYIPHGLVLQGAGPDKTFLVGPARQSPVILVKATGSITIEGFTLRNPPLPAGVDERDKYPHAIDVSFAPLTLRHLRLEQLPFYALRSYANRLLVDDVHIAPVSNGPVTLAHTLAGTKLKGLIIAPMTYGEQVRVEHGRADFEDLNPGLGDHAKLTVAGASSVVRFGNLAPALLERVQYRDGTKPDGVGAAPAVIPEDVPEFAQHQKASQAAHVARRKLTREFHAALKTAVSVDAASPLLATYLTKFRATEVAEEFDRELFDHVTYAELRAFNARFGAAATVALLPKLPSRDPEMKLDSAFGRHPPPLDIQLTIDAIEAEKWIAAEFPDLPTLLGAWKKGSASDPSAGAKTLVATLKTLSEKAKSLTPAVKRALCDRAVAEFRAFAKERGTPALDHVLRQFDAPEKDVVTPAHLHAALTADQRLALVQWWKGKK